MTDIILAGSGGCMRELIWQIQELNKVCPTWNIIGYVDYKSPEDDGQLCVGGQKIPYLGDDDFLLQKAEPVNVAICVGSPALRKMIAEKLKQNPQICFPNLILGDTRICEDVRLGEGCIISMDARISTNVHLGNFVFLNTGSMVCHDGSVGDYVTLGPDVKLAGNVSVGACSDLGIGTKVIQGLQIGLCVTTGAGSVIVKDIESDITVVGVPARKMRGKE